MVQVVAVVVVVVVEVVVLVVVVKVEEVVVVKVKVVVVDVVNEARRGTKEARQVTTCRHLQMAGRQKIGGERGVSWRARACLRAFILKMAAGGD